jgi:hypothetical membrane protein
VDASAPRRWSEATVVGIAVYVLIDVALVFLRPHFSVLHNAESDYGSKGRFGWVMNVNFLLRGVLSLTLVGALALEVGTRAKLRVGIVLLSLWAICSALLAFFPDDPVGTPTLGSGKIHLALAGIAFLAVLLGTFVTVRELRADERFAPVRRRLLALSWAGVVAVVLLGHSGLHRHSLGGLWEKVFLGCELGWFLLVALWIVRLEPESADPSRPPA